MWVMADYNVRLVPERNSNSRSLTVLFWDLVILSMDGESSRNSKLSDTLDFLEHFSISNADSTVFFLMCWYFVQWNLFLATPQRLPTTLPTDTHPVCHLPTFRSPTRLPFPQSLGSCFSSPLWWHWIKPISRNFHCLHSQHPLHSSSSSFCRPLWSDQFS